MRRTVRVIVAAMLVFFGILVAALFSIVLFILFSNRPQIDKPVKIGGVFIDSIEDDGWSEIHYEGLSEACKELDLPLEIVEHVDETAEATAPAVAELVSKGCNCFFLTSGGFGNNCRKIIESYPNVFFLPCPPNVTRPMYIPISEESMR